MLESGRAMDKTVAEAKFYADGNGQTLLITTADHETGGLTVEDGPFRAANSDYKMILDWTTTAHTGVDVPLTASGPGGRELVGNYENTHVYDAMAGALGIPTAQRAKAAA